VPQELSSKTYYAPLSTNFAAVDALTKEAGLQYTVAEIHPIKSVKVIKQLATLYPGGVLPLVFVVPEPIAADFKKQKIVTTGGKPPVDPPFISQFVAGLSVGFDTSLEKLDKKRKV
jgi:hypothetical protein